MSSLQAEARLPLFLAVQLYNCEQIRAGTAITVFLQPAQGFSKPSQTKSKAWQVSKSHFLAVPFYLIVEIGEEVMCRARQIQILPYADDFPLSFKVKISKVVMQFTSQMTWKLQ